METFSPQDNKAKYERNGRDLISQWEEISPKLAVSFCIQNVQKFALRYESNSIKARNDTDVSKALDYLSRAKAISGKEYRYYIEQLTAHLRLMNMVAVESLCNNFLTKLHEK